MEQLLGRPVDLVMPKALQNPYFAESVAHTPRSSMRPEASALVADAIRALDLVGQFIAGKPIADYEADVLVKSAVERQLHIAGEALADL